MSLAVLTPVLNEKFFLPLFLPAVLSFADEVLILDGGSGDGTEEILSYWERKSSAVRVWRKKQKGKPYSPDWGEGERRQFLLDQVKCEWVLALDCDEFVSDNFVRILPSLLQKNCDLYEFAFLPFWKDPFTIRLSPPQDPHWAGFICRMGRKKFLRYSSKSHHSPLLFKGFRADKSQARCRIEEVKIFHYHYALGPKLKENDNRRGDVNILQGKGEPDWSFEPRQYQIWTRPFWGSHPRIIENYLQEGKG